MPSADYAEFLHSFLRRIYQRRLEAHEEPHVEPGITLGVRAALHRGEEPSHCAAEYDHDSAGVVGSAAANLTQAVLHRPMESDGRLPVHHGSHRGAWSSDSGVWSPRIGVAYRLGDKMSVRAGYGRYANPWSMDTTATDQFSTPHPGFSNYTDAQPSLLGVPQMKLSNPFNSAYPVQPSIGNQYGAYTGLGGGLTYFVANRPHSYSNRFNISFQRQLPKGVIADVTYFMNRSSIINNVNYDINQVDPRIALQYGAATNVTVANPFYHLAIPNPSPRRSVEPGHGRRHSRWQGRIRSMAALP